MKIKKGLTLLTALTLGFTLLTANVEAASTPFTQGGGYEQGAYDTSAVQPLGFNWNKNSRFAGVSKNIHIKWTFQKTGYGNGSLTIDDEGNLYSTGSSLSQHLYSISPDGTERWKYTSSKLTQYSSPVLRSNKEILINTTNELNSIDLNTGILSENIANISSGHIFSESVIDSNGVIYTITASGLFAYNPDGTTKWSKQITLKNWSEISLSTDGTLYFITDSKLYAYESLNGNIKWVYTIPIDSKHYSAPTIDSSGDIYIVDNVGNIHAINPDGSLKWQYLTEKLTSSSTRRLMDPFIGLDGTIYATNGNRNLYALDQNGTLKWTFTTSGPVYSAVIDKNNKIYISANDNLINLDSNGNQLWSLKTGTGVLGSSLVIAEDGTIYVGTNNGTIYAIGGEVEENPTDPPVDPKPPVEPPVEPPIVPVGERALLVITLNNGTEKEYDLSMQEVQQFINWYEVRATGIGSITYAINKHNNNIGPFKQRLDYIVYDKIITFEVNEY